MGASKTITYLLTFILFSITFAEVRFFPERSQTFSQNRYPASPAFLLENLDTNVNERNLKEDANQTAQPVTMRLKGDTNLGYYYVTLFFGTPIQKQTLIVDTGSMTTTIPCAECGDNCGTNHFDRPFNHNDSSTFEKFECEQSFGDFTCNDCSNQCPFGVSYVEGSSYSGHFSRDFVVFGNEIEDNFAILNFASENDTSLKAIDLELDTSGNETVLPDFAQNNTDDQDDNIELRAQQALIQNIIDQRKIFMPFGCTYRETKLFFDQEADGILGLGIQTNTADSPPNLLDALHLNNSGFSKAFSLCLAQDGGYFSVGGYNHAYHESQNIAYVDYFTEHSQFRVALNKIKIAGKDLGLDSTTLNKGEGAFFDSGTTLSYFPTATYNAIVESINSFCSSNSSNCANGQKGDKMCWNYKKSEYPTQAEFLNTFPTLMFYFGQDGSAEYEWKPEDYFYERDSGKYCIGISKYNRETILGATFMKNHDVMFDKTNKKIGMVRANCSAVNYVTTPLYGEHDSAPSQREGPSPIPVATNFVGTGDDVVSRQKSSDYWKIILLSIVIVAVSAVVGVGIFLCVRYRRKSNYNDMSAEVEIPNKRGDGVSGDTSMEHNPSTPKLQQSQPGSASDLEATGSAQAPKMVISVTTE